MAVIVFVCGALAALGVAILLGRRLLNARHASSGSYSDRADSPPPRSPSPGRWRPWSQEVLWALGSFPMAGVVAFGYAFEQHQAWNQSQLVLTTTEGDTLVLDCLVPPAGRRRRARTLRTPMTLRAHLPASCAGPPGVDARVLHWVESGDPVDISIGLEGERPVVRIADARSVVTLVLEEAVTGS